MTHHLRPGREFVFCIQAQVKKEGEGGTSLEAFYIVSLGLSQSSGQWACIGTEQGEPSGDRGQLQSGLEQSPAAGVAGRRQAVLKYPLPLPVFPPQNPNSLSALSLWN